MTDLRDYQIAVVDRLRATLRGGRMRPVVMAPTGAGKTVIAAQVIRLARERHKRVAFCVPSLTLIDQAVEMFADAGITDVGVLQANHPLTDPSRPVQVCSVQTLQRRGYPDVDGVILDECHVRFKFLDKWMRDTAWQRKPFIGLSATPWSKGLGTVFTDLLVATTTDQLIQSGFLTPFRVFAPYHPDLSNVKIVAGDYHEGQLSTVMNHGDLVADVVTTWMRQAEGRPTFIFAVDCAHAQALQAKFNAAGVPCGYMDAFTPRTERNKIRDAFHRGELKAVANVGVLTIGIDWDVRCIVVCRPTRSEILHVQIIGRGLRTAEGKDDLLILDHSDNHLRLGFVNDINHTTLDDGVNRRKPAVKAERLPKECPHCHALKQPGVLVCVECGFKPVIVCNVKNKAGDLFELTRRGGTRECSHDHVQLPGGLVHLKEFHQQLRGYARTHNYATGWAAHQFKRAVGTWPPFEWNRLSPMEPTPPVSSWVQGRLIAYAKGMAKGRAHDGSAP